MHLNAKGKLHASLFFLYILTVSFGFLNARYQSPYFSTFELFSRFASFICLLSVAFALFRISASNNGSFEKLWKILTLSFGCYIGINIIGAILGIENQYLDYVDMIIDDPKLSFWDRRIVFPFSITPNNFAIETGLFVILLLSHKNIYHRKTMFYIAMFSLISIIIIIACNSRSVLLAIFVTIVVALTPSKYKFRLQISLFISILVFPLFLVFSQISKLPLNISELFALFSRSGDPWQIITLNNRTRIWELAIYEIEQFRPLHFIGFGIYGQVGSGIAYDYARNIWSNMEQITLHNAFIQHFIDFGYSGLFIFILLIINIYLLDSKNPYSSSGLLSKCSTNIVTYLILNSLFNNALSFSNPLIFLSFALCNFEIVSRYSNFVSWKGRQGLGYSEGKLHYDHPPIKENRKQ